MAVDAERAKSLFLAASELADPGERAAYLDRECGDNSELRYRIEALLRANDASPLPPLAEDATSEPGTGEYGATSEYTPEPDEAADRFATTTDYHSQAATGRIIAGRYTLKQKIGEGGMGEVWVARQSEPVKRKVAMKLIKTGMDSKAVLQRFEQERQALALMDHPNIARVFDGGITPAGLPFFVMELVNGLPLNKYCDETNLSVNERLELFVPICQAVQHAHQKGIVHRDLKPANILVTIVDGRPVPKVIDFGVAKAISGNSPDDSLLTQFGSVVGTLEYMAPEQAGYSGNDVDTRADIYSLGVILYELLTGLRPIDAARLKRSALTEMIRIIREEEPPKPSTRLSTEKSLPSLAAVRKISPKKLMALLSGELDWIVMKCLEKQRDRRYETANALVRDIQRYLVDEPVEARPPSAAYRMRKFLLRNPGIVLAFALAVPIVIWGGWTWNMSQTLREQERLNKLLQDAIQARDAASIDRDKANRRSLIAQMSAVKEQKRLTFVANQALEKAEEQRKNAAAGQYREALAKERVSKLMKQIEYESYLAKISLASEKIEDNAFDDATRILDEYVNYPWRDWEWNRLKYLRSRNLGTVTALTPQNAVAISTSGHQFAVGGEDGTVALYFTDEALKPHNERQREPKPVWAAKHSGGSPVHSVAFSPDDRLVISGADDGTIEIRSVDAGPVPIWSEQAHDDAVLSVRTAQDSRHAILITASKDQSIAVWDLKTQRQLQRLLRHSWWVWDAVPAPDLSYLVSAGQDGKLIYWTRDSQESEPPQFKYHMNAEVAPLHGGPVYSVDISADGQFVASAGDNGDVLLWSLSDMKAADPTKRVAEGTIEPLKVITLTAHTRPVRCVRFSPDPESKRLVSSGDDQTVRLWNRRRGTLETTFRGHGKPVSSCALTPPNVTQLAKDAVIVSAGRDQKTLLWDTAGYGEFRVFRAEVLAGHSGPVRYATFNGDGTLIATVSADESLRVRRIDSGHIKFHITNAQSYREDHSFPANSVALFRTGPHAQKWAVTSGLDGRAFLWDLDSRTSIFQFGGVGSNAVVVLTPDERHLLTDGRDGEALLWDLSALPDENPPQPVVLLGHDKAVTAAAFSSDGRYCLTGDAAGHCRLHDLNHSGDGGVELLLGTLPGDLPQARRAHSQKVTAVAFLSGTPLAVTASMDKTVQFWDWKSHEAPVEIPEKRLVHPNAVTNMLLTQDPPLLVTVSVIPANAVSLPLSRLRAYRPDTGKLVAEAKTTDAWVTGLAQYDSKPRFLLTLTVNGQDATNRLALWSPSEPANRQLVPLKLPEQTGSIWSAEVFPDHSRLIASGGRRTRIWGIEHSQADTPALTPLGIEFGPHAAISSVAFAPQKNLIVTGDDYGDIKVWNMDTERAVVRIRDAHAGKVVALAFDPANPKCMMSAGGRTICVWKRGDGEDWTLDKTIEAHVDVVTSAAYSPDGTSILTTSRDGSVRLWDSRSGIERAPIVPSGKGRAAVLCAVLSRDGALLAIGGEDPTSPAQIWKHDPILDSWYLAANIHGHPAAVTSVAFSNGRHPSRLFTSSLDGTIKVWDMTRFSKVNDAKPIDDLALLLAGESIDGLIRYLQSHNLPTASGRIMKSLVTHLKTIGMEFNPKYKWPPSIPDADPARNLFFLKQLLEDLETRRLNQVASENDKKPDSDLLDAGKYLAQMEPILERCRLIVEGVDDLEEILTLRGHKRAVNSVVMSPVSDALLSASDDETAILWPVAQSPPPVRK